MNHEQPAFQVITGKFIESVLNSSRRDIIDIVKKCYLVHHQGKTENPSSYFLHFRDKPEARIIALPAAINHAPDMLVSGIKWISSYPRNIENNLQRASAVILLNDYETGYPFACLEASQISAARTAASAVLATDYLWPLAKHAKTLAIIGGGVISRTILSYYKDDGWEFDQVIIHDLSKEHLHSFVNSTEIQALYPVSAESDLATALQADIVMLATTAGEPYILAKDTFSAQQLVLNISLRDLSPSIIECSNNIFDDVEHCMKANTSPHLAEQKFGHREFVTGTLAEIINGEKQLDPSKPTIFSPFGLGVLDLSLAMFINQKSNCSTEQHIIPDFFPETKRWNDEKVSHA